MATGSARVIPIADGPGPDTDASLERVVRVVLSGGTSTAAADIVLASDDSDAAVPIFRIPANTLVTDFGWKVDTAFDADVDLSFGDSDDADGWAQVDHVGATTADTNVNWSSRTWIQDVETYAEAGDTTSALSTQPAYGNGKFVGLDTAQGDNFALNVTTANITNLTAGLIECYLKYVPGWDRNRRLKGQV